MRRTQQGMTLIEIIVAVAVIAILAGAITPTVLKQIEKGKKARTLQDLASIKAAFLQYYTDTSYWPCSWDPRSGGSVRTAFTGFTCLYQADGQPGWDGPYLDDGASSGSGTGTMVARSGSSGWLGVVDPWKRPYQIYQASTGVSGASYGEIVIFSQGKNGTTDTSDGDLLAGSASGDDLVLIITRKAAS